MKRLIFGGILAITLLALWGAKPRVIAIDPPLIVKAPIAVAAIIATSTPPTPQEVVAYIEAQSVLFGVNPIDSKWIVDHESQDGVNMSGDDGQSRGYWMISKVWHPEVSAECANDLSCSTTWSLMRIRAGYINEWTTWKYRFKWFAKENPPL